MRRAEHKWGSKGSARVTSVSVNVATPSVRFASAVRAGRARAALSRMGHVRRVCSRAGWTARVGVREAEAPRQRCCEFLRVARARRRTRTRRALLPTWVLAWVLFTPLHHSAI